MAKSQAPAYRKANLGVKLVIHPDSIKGVPLKRQWIYDKYGDVCMVDDDLTEFVRTYLPKYRAKKKYTRMTPEEATAAVNATYETAKNLGAYLFGFAYAPSPLWYRAQLPFKLNEAIKGAVLGMIAGSGLTFDERCVSCGDTYISAMNAYANRYLFVDSRFAYTQIGTFSNPGGLSGIRSHATEVADRDLLVQLFGKAVTERGGNRAITGPRKSPGSRTLHIPF